MPVKLEGLAGPRVTLRPMIGSKNFLKRRASGDAVEIRRPFASKPATAKQLRITRADLHRWFYGEWTSKQAVLDLYRDVQGSVFHRPMTAAEGAHVLSVLERAFERGVLLAVRAGDTAPILAVSGSRTAEQTTLPELEPSAKRPIIKKTWISIQLVDDKKAPVVGVAYEIVRGTGVIASGRLDEHGSAFVDGISDGDCKVRFPDLDASEWA